MPTLSLTPQSVRRLAITRQRLAGPGPANSRDGLMEIFRDLGCIQIDPIRAVERTQYLVLWSRLGAYDPAHLAKLLWQEKSLFEYWAHAASIVLTEDYPIHQAQMRRFASDDSSISQKVRAWLQANDKLRRHILQRLAQDGPLAATEFEDLTVVPWTSTGWTHERNVTRMLDFLWSGGEIMVAERDGLKKKWGLADHHLPDWTPRSAWSDEEVVRHAAQKSLRALGAATQKQINNHFIRGNYPNLTAIIADLVAEGRLVPVSLRDGDSAGPDSWYIHAADVPLAEQLEAGQGWHPTTTLLSPFDNLICDRERTEQLWNFYFRIEIYVPAAKRQYGYYVLPILHGDRLIGRIDPTMDRKKGVLHLNAIYLEPDTPPDQATAQAVAASLADLAHFLGAKEIRYGDKIPAGWRALF
jgi:hypothetical protein